MDIPLTVNVDWKKPNCINVGKRMRVPHPRKLKNEPDASTGFERKLCCVRFGLP